jgi:hypothetical protein
MLQINFSAEEVRFGSMNHLIGIFGIIRIALTS